MRPGVSLVIVRRMKLLKCAPELDERQAWIRLTENFRCCGELLRVALGGPEKKQFYCKVCGVVWVRK